MVFHGLDPPPRHMAAAYTLFLKRMQSPTASTQGWSRGAGCQHQ